jgi:predicted deacylase
VHTTIQGIRAVMAHLGMIPPNGAPEDAPEPIICARSYWLRTRLGGVLHVRPGLLDRLEAGEPVAEVREVFGDVLDTYTAPEAGIVVGRSTNPVAPTGSRILHLGVPVDSVTS